MRKIKVQLKVKERSRKNQHKVLISGKDRFWLTSIDENMEKFAKKLTINEKSNSSEFENEQLNRKIICEQIACCVVLDD